MKNLIVIIFIGCFLPIHSQVVRPYFSASAFRNTDFKNQTYFNMSLGTEFKTFSFLKPEIEIGYTFGLLEEFTSRDDNFLINNISQVKISALNFGFCPKFLVYTDDDNWYSFNILPKYVYSQITATNDYADVKTNGEIITPLQSITYKKSRHSFGIGIGFCVNFSQNKSSSMAINLYFNNIELGDAINKLENNKKRILTKDNIGLGLVYYFNL